MNSKIALVVALMIPIVALTATALQKAQQRATGVEVTLPIEGFDPRDLLSGHYLTYQIDYGIHTGCPTQETVVDLCLEPIRAIYPQGERPTHCHVFLRGYCDSSSAFLVENLNRFYIPEQYATELDRRVRDKQGSLVLSVDNAGNAIIKDLLIDGEPWKTAVQRED